MLEQCPLEFVNERGIWMAIKLARFARRGTWPILGGVLDQCKWFMEAADEIWGDQAYWRAKKGIPSDGE